MKCFNKNNQKGFTLVELMISIVLGLLLVAAAIQLLINGQIAYKVQQAGAAVQDSGLFGLSYITQSIRFANYGNIGPMNDETLFGGIVLSGETVSASLNRDGNLKGLKVGGNSIVSSNYLTSNAKNTSAYGDNSDQLVVMYEAPKDMQNCRGENVAGPIRSVSIYTPGQYVIERYYINKNSITKESALYCDATIFTDDETARKSLLGLPIGDYGNGGVMIINNVDMMRIQLMIRTDGGTRSIPIDKYNEILIANESGAVKKTSRPAIIGINLGMLIRSTDKAGAPEPASNTAKTYTVLDKTVTDPNDGYLRKAYVTTIALRNGGLGEVISND